MNKDYKCMYCNKLSKEEQVQIRVIKEDKLKNSCFKCYHQNIEERDNADFSPYRAEAIEVNREPDKYTRKCTKCDYTRECEVTRHGYETVYWEWVCYQCSTINIEEIATTVNGKSDRNT